MLLTKVPLYTKNTAAYSDPRPFKGVCQRTVKTKGKPFYTVMCAIVPLLGPCLRVCLLLSASGEDENNV